MTIETINKSSLIDFRAATSADKSFILATWLRGLRFGNDWFRLIDANSYFSTYHALIETILNRPNITVKVACLKEDPEVVLGYSVYENNRLDWVYVKKAWRSIGIAKTLTPENVTTVSHLTTIGRSILLKYPKVVFNPFFN